MTSTHAAPKSTHKRRSPKMTDLICDAFSVAHWSQKDDIVVRRVDTEVGHDVVDGHLFGDQVRLHIESATQLHNCVRRCMCTDT